MDSSFEKLRDSDLASEPQKKEIKRIDEEYENKKHATRGPDAYHIEHIDVEKGKVAEMNVEFYNERLGKYVNDVNEQEKKSAEIKNKNWFTKLTSWFEKTELRRVLKIGGKVVGGIAALTMGITGAGGFLSPALLALGGRNIVDGVIEGVQFWGGEEKMRQDLQKAQVARTSQIIKMMELRHTLQEKFPGKIIDTGSAETIEATRQNVNKYLQTLVEETEKQEKIIIETQQKLAKRVEKFGKIRFAAGIASTVTTLGYASIYGLSFGAHNFDVGTKGADYLKNLYDAHGAMASSAHNVKLYSDGFHFVYSGAEHAVNGSIPSLTEHAHRLGVLSSGFTHKLAGAVPWWKLWASTAGGLAAMGASTYHEYNRMKNTQEFTKMAKEIGEKPALFSLLKDPKTKHGAFEEFATQPSTLLAKAIGKESKAQTADRVEGFYKNEIKPDQIITCKGILQTGGFVADKKTRRYAFLEKQGTDIILVELDKKDEEINRLRMKADLLYNAIKIDKEATLTAGTKKAPETTTATTNEEVTKWLEDKDIIKENRIEIGSGSILKDKDDDSVNVPQSNDWIIANIDIKDDKIRLERKEKIVGKKGEKIISHNIGIEALKEAMANHPGSIEIWREKKKKSETSSGTSSDSEIEPEYLDELKNNVNISEGVETFIDLKKHLWKIEDTSTTPVTITFWKIVTQNKDKTIFWVQECNSKGKPENDAAGNPKPTEKKDAKDFVREIEFVK